MFLIGYKSYQNYQFYWMIHSIAIPLPYVFMFIIILSTGCILFIYFFYYKIRFDQLNGRICEIFAKCRIINKKEKLFLKLIDEHNLLAIEIQKANLFYWKTAATCFLFFSSVKITTVYVTIYSQHTLLKLLAVNSFMLCFIFGFVLSSLFSLQINSAKNNYKIMHSIVCKSKMRLKLKFKVNQNFVNLN